MTTKTLTDLTPLDARRVELAVTNRAGFLAAAPFIGRDAETITRYIADGKLGEQMPHVERAHLWQIVENYLREHPDLMDRDDDERERVLREHAAHAAELEEKAGLALSTTDYSTAARLLTELEAHDPDRRLGANAIPIGLMRVAMEQRLTTPANL
ncbi:hypothetical protein [Kineococcus sp. R86509]|uniref:hypothetical protein n=1 Tax=Kineococcus sp. R86509 TaxID=3093851 RepID=UPI0036D2CE60